MNVQELIEMLQDLDPNMEVKFAYDSNDYWRTEVAVNVNNVEIGHVVHSEYHSMDKVVDNGDDDEEYRESYEPDEGSKEVVILR